MPGPSDHCPAGGVSSPSTWLRSEQHCHFAVPAVGKGPASQTHGKIDRRGETAKSTSPFR